MEENEEELIAETKARVKRNPKSRVMSVVNNLYSTRRPYANADEVIYCLTRMKQVLRIPQQQLIVMFLEEGMKRHAEFSKMYGKFIGEWRGSDVPGESEGGGEA